MRTPRLNKVSLWWEGELWSGREAFESWFAQDKAEGWTLFSRFTLNTADLAIAPYRIDPDFFFVVFLLK